ncbi:MAG: arsenate reductase (glutaredoxin) [Pseudomonadota bacterium]
MDIVIHHNPDCGTSRNVLRIVRDAGFDPVVVEYLERGWSREHLLTLFAAAGVSARDALRVSKSPAEELGLLDPGVSDVALIDAMLAHPVLVNRPFVVCARGVRLCRPSETVLDLLPTWPKGPYAHADGTPILDASGRRIDGSD